MKIALLIVAGLWTAQTLALVFWFLPRAAQAWAWQGYWLGRKHQVNGTPPPMVLVPSRKGSSHE